MANAKEQFGLSEKPMVTGVIERDVNKPIPADDYSAGVMAEETEKPAKKTKAVENKVKALKLTVSGNVRRGEEMVPYTVNILIPECPDNELQYHSQRFVIMELAKTGKLYDGVLTRNIDEIEESTLELTFIGKDIFSLSKEEIQYACDYYDLLGCGYNNPSIRALQKEFYKNYMLKTDNSLNDKLTQQEFITKIDGIQDYKKIQPVKLEA